MEIKQIFEGWKNDLFPAKELKDTIERISKERISICKTCKGYDETGTGCSLPLSQPCCNKNIVVGKNDIGDDTKGCGCPLSKKTKCLSCDCPVKKWRAVITIEQEQLITDKLK